MDLSTEMNTSDCPTRWQSVEEEATAELPGSGSAPSQHVMREHPAAVAATGALKCNNCQQQAPKNSGHIAIFSAFYPACAFLSKRNWVSAAFALSVLHYVKLLVARALSNADRHFPMHCSDSML